MSSAVNVPAEKVLLKKKARHSLARIFRNKTILVGAVLFVVFFVISLFPGLFFSQELTIKTDSSLSFVSPSAEHPFGTDHLGRDLLARVIWGARISLGISFCAMLFALAAGSLLGLLSGYIGRRFDIVLGRIIDVLYSFPAQILGIFIAGILGPGVVNIILAIGIVFIPVFYRTMRGSVIKEKNREYVEAARALGMNHVYIMFVHILRNSLVPVSVQFTVGMAVAIQLEAALGFLGLGVQPPLSSWGSILNDGIKYLMLAPWISVMPGLFMVLAVFTFNLLGDGFRDLFDPQREK
jgi:peptide/nickel transport system permease protein